MVVEAESLGWWLDWVNVVIGMMGDAHLRGVVELDYSPGSLQALEEVVRERYRGRYPLGDDAFAAGVAAYVGETLMRVGGGAWDWSTQWPGDAGSGDGELARHCWFVSGADEPDAVGLPVVRPDPVTGLSPVSPVHLLLEAAQSSDGGVWVSTYQGWRDAVDAYVAAHPGWAPSKQHTLADGVFSSPPPSAVLDEWLAGQRADFPRWAARYGGQWDYSPDSIDRLTALVSALTPTVEAFNDPANAEFVEGACFYLGETLRRGIPCRWVYRDVLTDEGDPVTASFEIQMNDNADFTGPFSLLRYIIRHRDPGDTRDFYHRWTKTPRTC